MEEKTKIKNHNRTDKPITMGVGVGTHEHTETDGTQKIDNSLGRSILHLMTKSGSQQKQNENGNLRRILRRRCAIASRFANRYEKRRADWIRPGSAKADSEADSKIITNVYKNNQNKCKLINDWDSQRKFD